MSTHHPSKVFLRAVWRHISVRRFWRHAHIWKKIVAVLVAIIFLWVGIMYAVARWYIASESNKPLVLGVSFIPDYAQGLGLNPQETMQAMIDQLGVKQFRLVSYWEDIEPSPGHYDFSQLDWEFQKAEAAHASISLSIGLRQPRWPECHMPSWVNNESESVWYPQLKQFMQAVVERYQMSSALKDYQLENEYFLKAFGQCSNFSRSRLIDEFNTIKQLDSSHPLIVSRSNNAIGLPVRQPTPDEFGVSVYKRVWDQTITHRYFEYPIPAWFYAYLAGAGKILTGKDMIIHELQAEPWPPHGEPIPYVSLTEQDKSLSATRLKDRFQYGEATGIRTIYMWGAEWWYWRLIKAHDPSIWNVAKQQFAAARAQNTKLTPPTN